MDPLSRLYEVLFFGLFGSALISYRRQPGPLTLDVALLFGALAGLFAVQSLRALWPQSPEALSQLGIVLLLAQPALAVRLSRHLGPLPRWAAPLTVAGYLLSLGLLLGLGTSHPLTVLVAVGYFLAGDGAAALILALEAMRRAGFARWRLLAAATAMALMAAAILLAAAGGPVASGAARGLVLVVGLALLLAFVPPRWLRLVGQQAIAYRFLAELVASGPGTGTEHLWQQLAESARGLTGALGCEVRLSDDAGEASVVTVGAVGARTTAATVIRFGGRSQRGAIHLFSRGAALFAEDDLELLELLGTQTLAAAERETVLAERSAMAQRLAATNVELMRASAAKSDFLAAMSHELRTPLNAIIGFSELLLAPVADEPPAGTVVREYAGHIHGAGLHLLDLINDILDLSRVEAGRLDLRHESIDVAKLLSATLATVRPLAEAKSLSIEVADRSPLVAEVDAARMRQIVYNLLSNAIKFTPSGGRVMVALTRDGGHLQLTVSDTGPGIAPADQERVFAAFEQLNPGAGEGTGLGLALTQRLVEAHGGQIELSSMPGTGSRFTAVLPLRRVAASGAAAVEAEPGSGPLVLIVEDDADAAELLRVQLRQAGYRAAVAADGESGLKAARRLMPAAILLDVLLPGLDGWEVLKRLRSDPVTGAIPVMVITIVDNAALGLALGAVDYFVKPVARETLLAAIGRLTFTTKVHQRTVTILAIDDDPAALALYRSALVPEGFRMIEAANGEEGLLRAVSQPVDLIVLDMLLPDLDGFEVAARLKSDPASAGIPILVVTGHELTAQDKERLNDHVLDVLTKGSEAISGLRAWLDRLGDRPAG